MKNRWILIGVAGAGVFFGAAGAAATSYNPIRWIKKSPSPTASDQLAANKEREKKLSLQLQAALPPRTSLKDACAGFKTLNDCVAGQGHGPVQSHQRAQAGRQCPDGSQERRETRPRRNLGRLLVSEVAF